MLTTDNLSHMPVSATTSGELDNIELIIFDCDGVLIDSEPIASRTLAEILRQEGVPITAEEAHARFTGNAVSIIGEMIAQDYGLTNIEGLFERWNKKLFAEFARALTPIPGIAEVVKNVSRPKCVASNSTMARLQRSLGHLELWQQFAPNVFSAEVVPRPKPAPDLMLYCAEQFSVSPQYCVMIDDSSHGIEAAVAAGMIAIGFVDPADPRPGRSALLLRAGALAVAFGAAELQDALSKANNALPQH